MDNLQTPVDNIDPKKYYTKEEVSFFTRGKYGPRRIQDLAKRGEIRGTNTSFSEKYPRFIFLGENILEFLDRMTMKPLRIGAK